DPARAADARRALQDADLLRPGSTLQLAHPLVAEAALALLGDEEAARIELLAARLLEQAGEDGSSHLLRTAPAPPYAWAREVLSSRGRRALADGAPEAAALALRAALAWHPTPQERETLSLATARAEIRSGRPDGVAGLLSACREARNGGVRAAAALELATILPLIGRDLEALEGLETTAASLAERERPLAAELEASWLFNACFRPELAARAHELARRRLADGPPVGATERLRLGTIAFLLCAQGREPASVTASFARTALAAGRLFDEIGVESPLPILPVVTLLWADRSDEVAAAYRAGLARAEKVGSVLGFCMLRGSAADAHFRRGALHESEADARAALETLTSAGLVLLIPPVIGSLVQVLMERGELQEAEALLEHHGLAGALPDTGFTTLLLVLRGQLRFAQRRYADAISDLRQCGERADRGHRTVPSIVPWRSSLASPLNATGETREAELLIEEEIDLARAHGAPRAIGRALRIAGAHAGASGEPLLHEAIEVLADTSAVLECAHAKYALGRLRLDRGEPRQARGPLREALDHAHSCGALALSARARAALITSGARPRRTSLSGPDALTATERRISGLAADGMTNAEIAQSQFTTLKTVEKHLTNAFRKLGIDSRRDLAPRA
ncbi:MAG: helix-turn-helix transcriptional regulator, partial [Actinomycetota bacterium]|nr:helix-turn-helix transcriptional regulator [Actinomycetota bacterium]